MPRAVVAGGEQVCGVLHQVMEQPSLGLEVTFTSTGREALALVKAGAADMLIAAACLKDGTGQEIITQAKAAAPWLETAVVDGDIRRETAERLVKAMVEHCATQRELATLRQACRDAKQCLQACLLRDLLAGHLGRTDAETLWENYCFRPETECLKLVLMQLDYGEDHQPLVGLAEKQATQMLSQELADVCGMQVICMDGGAGGVLLGFDKVEGPAVRRRLIKCLKQLCASGLPAGVKLTMATGDTMTDVQALGSAARQARQMLLERLVQGTGKLLEKPPVPCGLEASETLTGYRQAVLALSEDYSSWAVNQAIDQLEKELKVQNASGGEIYEIVFSAAHLLLKQPQVADGKRKIDRFVSRMVHTGQASQLFEMLRTLAEHEREELIQRQHSAGSRPVRIAKEYVLKHYREPVTLEQVCQEAGFSVSYFSTLFKKETGENFVHFLARTRVERAKELLSQTSLPVSEICTQVGYSDLKYFAQTFKRETGLPPGQYRRQRG